MFNHGHRALFGQPWPEVHDRKGYHLGPGQWRGRDRDTLVDWFINHRKMEVYPPEMEVLYSFIWENHGNISGSYPLVMTNIAMV